MNVSYLKYALEIQKTGSISKAAENLYMGQPNLSRAIKDLESNVGITIFKRTPKGIETTPDGIEFLNYAQKIIDEIDDLTKMYKSDRMEMSKFSISVPRASYIAEAFTKFTKNIDLSKQIEFFYKETNSSRAINNILQADYKLGIIRYQTNFDRYFKRLLDEKGLSYVLITEFSYVLIMSKDSPLASKKEIEISDLKDYCEIAHGDPYVPSLPFNEAKKHEFTDEITKRIFVFERGSQFTLLESNPQFFMWVSPVPIRLLDKYNLIERKCSNNQKIYKDLLIYKKGYNLTDLDNQFISLLCEEKRLMKHNTIDK